MTAPNTVLITGAARGLGQSTAAALAAAGSKVIVTYRGDAADADATLDAVTDAGSVAAPLRLDVSTAASFPAFASEVRRVLDSWGETHLGALVNNAGIGLFAGIEDVTEEEFDRSIATNVKGPLFLIQALMPLMTAGSSVVNISTMLTRRASPGSVVYASSKTAVEGLALALANELGSKGICINTIAPGPTATDFNGGAMRDNDQLREALAGQTALGRVGEPDEVSDAIVALVSSGMRWVTGERIEVSGGSLL
jgi:NAD(P)-dependent dehydrogenase (short-subunit alcohol dehydrogenase family)